MRCGRRSRKRFTHFTLSLAIPRAFSARHHPSHPSPPHHRHRRACSSTRARWREATNAPARDKGVRHRHRDGPNNPIASPRSAPTPSRASSTPTSAASLIPRRRTRRRTRVVKSRSGSSKPPPTGAISAASSTNCSITPVRPCGTNNCTRRENPPTRFDNSSRTTHARLPSPPRARAAHRRADHATPEPHEHHLRGDDGTSRDSLSIAPCKTVTAP